MQPSSVLSMMVEERVETGRQDLNKTGTNHLGMNKLSGYDFTNYSKTFRFGVKDSSTIAVDLSLANLFQKLTVECRGILANPQWKHYRHMQLLKKDQIRLSNGIWRSWHVQFQKGRKPLFCKFEINPDDDMESHGKPQSVVIEGKYWKRTTSAVADEYRKWRLFYKQRNQWSDIKRLPTGVQQPEGNVQAMQVDVSETNKLSHLLQGLEEFPDVFMNMARPGDERSYMRPLVGAAEMMQPNLEMLNPSLEELLDRLEPMEVIFNPLFNAPRPPFVSPSYHHTPQTTPTPPQYENQSNMQQYGNQSPYVTPPTKSIPISPKQPYSQVARGHVPGYQGEADFRLSPSAFLNAPHAQEVRVRSDTDSAMDIGTPPTFSNNSQFKSPSLYATGPTPTFSPQGEELSSLMFPPTTPPNVPPHIYNYPPPTGSYNSPNATPTFPQPPTHSLTNYNEGVPNSAYKAPPPADPGMHFIAQQMKQLEEQQLEQLREIEKQQSIATQQYLRLLEQYVSNSSNEQPSERQQKELAAVLSDPSSVQILKSILTSELDTPSTPPTIAPPIISVKKELISPQQSSNNLQALVDPTTLYPPSPTQIVKDSGVSDFQSRLVMAAAAQACNSSPFSTSSASPTVTDTHMTMSQPIEESTLSSATGGISPALLKKFKNARNLTPDEKRVYQELRRQSHITAEQKRRGSIKNGFEQLQSLVINPLHHPSGKVSKAVLLEKTIEYLQKKHKEREVRVKRIDELQAEIRQLNSSITICQQELPASGVPVTGRQRFEENKQLFKDYVQQRTNQNYKFWIYSIILQYLFESYNNSVSTVSPEALCQSVLTWFDQNCSLPALRPVVMSSLKELSVKTSILSDPSKLPEQLTHYATTTKKQ